MMRLTPLALAAALVSLAGAPTLAGQAASAGPKEINLDFRGRYTFEQRGGASVIEGMFWVKADTIQILEMTPGTCQYDVRASSTLALSYICGDITIMFNRVDPIRRSRIAFQQRIIERTTICLAYSPVDPSRCIRSTQTTEEVFKPTVSPLRAQRVVDP